MSDDLPDGVLAGLAGADAHLGAPFPLPRAPLPLARWVDVHADGPDAVEVAWNLDDTRPGTPGRLALRAGRTPAAPRAPFGPPRAVRVGDAEAELRTAPLEEAEPSLRPAYELRWAAGGLHLRLTAQGPWAEHELLHLAASASG